MILKDDAHATPTFNKNDYILKNEMAEITNHQFSWDFDVPILFIIVAKNKNPKSFKIWPLNISPFKNMYGIFGYQY